MYTLRYIPNQHSLDTVIPSLKEVLSQIPEIAAKLSTKVKVEKQGYIENNFPLITCPNCGSETFDILFGVNASLNHDGSNYPEIEIKEYAWPPGPNQMSIDCKECEEEIDDPEDLKAIYELLLDRVRRQPYE